MKKEKHSILVIDDDLSMIRLLEKWLINDGYTILTASSGQTGIALARQHQPSCIILDIMIPDLSGIEVAKKLQEDNQTRGIPIVFITVTMGVENDKGDERIEIAGTSFRAFAKPLHQRKLLSVVRKEINRRVHGNS